MGGRRWEGGCRWEVAGCRLQVAGGRWEVRVGGRRLQVGGRNWRAGGAPEELLELQRLLDLMELLHLLQRGNQVVHLAPGRVRVGCVEETDL